MYRSLDDELRILMYSNLKKENQALFLLSLSPLTTNDFLVASFRSLCASVLCVSRKYLTPPPSQTFIIIFFFSIFFKCMQNGTTKL